MGLTKLNKLDFLKLVPNREAKINAAPEKKLPELKEYKANQIAQALHPGWQKMVVSKVEKINEDASLFTLSLDADSSQKTPAYFSAGQYLSLQLKIGNVTTTRPYTICSSPKDALKGFYKILVKRVPDGFASNYILNNWKESTKVNCSEPLGTFTYEPLRDAKNVIGIAGGSGISVFYSLAKAIAEGTENCSLTLLYGSKTEKDIILKNELEELSKNCDKIKIVHVLSQEKKEGYENGFITADLIKKYSTEGEYSIFVCGPQAMYDYEKEQIATLCLRRKFVRYELSGIKNLATDYPAFPKEKEGTYKLTVKYQGQEKTIDCSSNQTILRTIENAGISVASQCRSGICGWCHSKLVSGEVFIPQEHDGRRLADAQFGYIHPCASFPLSDLVIEVPVINP